MVLKPDVFMRFCRVVLALCWFTEFEDMENHPSSLPGLLSSSSALATAANTLFADILGC